MKRFILILTLLAPPLCLAQPASQPANEIVLRLAGPGDSFAFFGKFTLEDPDLPYPTGFIRQFVPAGTVTNADQAKAYISTLRELVRSDPAMPKEARAKRVAEIRAAIDSLQNQSNALIAILAETPDITKQFANRLTQLREKEQNTRSDLIALEARQEAIQMGLNELRKDAAMQRDRDVVAREMEKIVSLREEQVDRARKQFQQGISSTSEVARAEAELAETRLRLLERQANIGKSGKGELMDRLTDELTMVSINTTDLRIQLSSIASEIYRIDPQKMTAGTLEAIMKNQPGIGKPGIRPTPLMMELDKKANELMLEWLKLVATDVEYFDRSLRGAVQQ